MCASNESCHRFEMSETDDFLEESCRVTWKWGNESSPKQSTAGTSQLKRSMPKKSKNIYRSNMTNKKSSSTASSTQNMASTDSPKGLYRFRMELQKFQFADDESDDTRELSQEQIATRATGVMTTNAAEPVVQPKPATSTADDSDGEGFIFTVPLPKIQVKTEPIDGIGYR